MSPGSGVGAVHWPTWSHSQPGSTYVYAIVVGNPDQDPFLPGRTAAGMLLVNAPIPDRPLQPLADHPTLMAWGRAVAEQRPVLTAVLLGAAPHVYHSRTAPNAGVPWYCSYGDLDARGGRIVDTLTELTARATLIVTFYAAPDHHPASSLRA